MSDETAAPTGPEPGPRRFTRVAPVEAAGPRAHSTPVADPEQRDPDVDRPVRASLVGYYVAVIALLAGIFLLMSAATSAFGRSSGQTTDARTAIVQGVLGAALALAGTRLYGRVTRRR